jgi:hypothetical protein
MIRCALLAGLAASMIGRGVAPAAAQTTRPFKVGVETDFAASSGGVDPRRRRWALGQFEDKLR